MGDSLGLRYGNPGDKSREYLMILSITIPSQQMTVPVHEDQVLDDLLNIRLTEAHKCMTQAEALEIVFFSNLEDFLAGHVRPADLMDEIGLR